MEINCENKNENIINNKIEEIVFENSKKKIYRCKICDFMCISDKYKWKNV